MPMLIPNPSFIIHESCYVYITLHYIHVPHRNIHTHQNRSSRNKQTFKLIVVSPSASLRLRGLAQPRRTRSRELPLRLGEGSRRKQKHSRDLAQARPLSPGRDARSLRNTVCRLGDHSWKKAQASLCYSRLGETSSLGRVYQCSTLFSPATDAKTYHKQPSHRIIHPYQQVNTQENHQLHKTAYSHQINGGFQLPVPGGRVNGSPDSTIASTIFPRTAKELENSGGTEPRGIYYEALTGHNAKENTYRLEGHLRGVGTGFELARRGPQANPSRVFCEG